MPITALQNIEVANFRANPAYNLILFDRLPSEQREALAHLQQEVNFYGLLCPRESSNLGVKSVCQDTALLFFTLQEPGKIPTYLKTIFGDYCNHVIIELVLDGILEIEQNGEFISGSAAYSAIYSQELSLAKVGSAMAQLSIEALKYT